MIHNIYSCSIFYLDISSYRKAKEVQTLQQEIDESITVRPKEFGHNLSLPRVKYNKTKPRNKKKQEKQKQRKQQKKQSPRKKEKQKTDYQPAKHQDPYHEVLPKRLRNPHVPGSVPNLHNIQEEPSNSGNNDSEKDPFHVDKKTIEKLENDLSKIKIKLKKVPITKGVSYEDIKGFPVSQNKDE